MKYFIFRNHTVEPFFSGFDACFSGYGGAPVIDESADAYIWLYFMPYRPDNDVTAEEVRHYGETLEMVYSSIGRDKTFIAFTMANLYAVNYVTSGAALRSAVEEYNRKIYALAENGNVRVIDIGDFYSAFSDEQLVDWKYYFISRMPLNPKLAQRFNGWFSRQLEILAMKRKKCVALDLDNTLWSGILGEDGADGIRMGGEYPGNAYGFFQVYLLELSRTGVILAICSKNNEADVFDVLENHPDMVLKKDAFSAYRINWNNKAGNIKNIAEELNIGLDSMVFIDDNPAERELVRQALPEVCVPEFPARPYLYPAFIKQLTADYFSAYALTQEDLSKTRQYRENAERSRHQGRFVDMDSYLRSLEIELTAERLNDFNRARFAQMTQKTNQFNLTSRRYAEADIQAFVDGGGLALGLRVKDKFGDNGITGLAIVQIDGHTARIDTLLLSCRILGREIEDAFVKYVLMKLKAAGVRQVQASYIKTGKNGQVSDFYDKLGFGVTKFSDESREYILFLDGADFTLSGRYPVAEI